MKIFIVIALYVIIAIIFVALETLVELKYEMKVNEEKIIIQGLLWPIISFVILLYLIIDFIRERFK